jgi:hypothetical protein
LKEKVLVLASVKKIQRAWRNYKTKKLIKSYSNNLSLKFAGKVKSQMQSGRDEPKILTVRSCGFNDTNSRFNQQAKKNLSHLMSTQGNRTKRLAEWGDELTKTNKKEHNAKSAIVKFQMQEINKWDELIQQLREGKNV